MNNKALIRNQIRQAVRSQQELKMANLVVSGTTATAGSVTYFTTIPQSLDINGRVGDRITIRSIKWDLGMDGTLSYLTRFIFFTDSMANGVAPAVTDVLSTTNYYSKIKEVAVQQNRYTVLYDKILTINAGAGSNLTRGGTIKKNLVVNFIGTTNGIASAGKGSLFLLVLSNTAGATFDFSTQIKYTDG